MRKSMFFFALFIPVFFAFTTVQNDRSDSGCPAPANLTLTNQTASSATFNWDHCGCGGNYHIYYSKNGRTSTEYVTGAPGINISGLSAGTYLFYFYTECAEGLSSIIVEEIVIG